MKTGLLLPAYGMVLYKVAPRAAAWQFIYSSHARETSQFFLLQHRALLHVSSGDRAPASPERKGGSFKRAIKIARDEESTDDVKNTSLYQPLQDDTRFDKPQSPQDEEFMTIPFLRPDLAISSARRRPKTLHSRDLPVTDQSDVYAEEVTTEYAAQNMSSLYPRQAPADEQLQQVSEEEHREIRKLIEDEINSARLFRAEDVEGPLTGSLLPIRPRKHRWTPMHMVAADRDDFITRNLESGRPNTLKVWWERRLHAYYWFTPDSFVKWLDRARTRKLVKTQSLDPVRLREIGPELCAANVVFALGGRVKFYGVDRWYGEKENNMMPSRFSEQITLEAVDLTNTEITYEGLENLIGLKSLRWLSLQNCHRLDDFCMPRLFTVHRTLEYLDLSGCQNITDRGLAWLHHMEYVHFFRRGFELHNTACPKIKYFFSHEHRNLKLLKVENMPNAPNVNIIALQLEDALPLCEFQGVSYTNPLHIDTPSVDLPNLPTTKKPDHDADADEDNDDFGNEEKWKKQSMIAQPGIVEVGNPQYGEVEAKRKLRNRMGPLYHAYDKQGNEKFG